MYIKYVVALISVFLFSGCYLLTKEKLHFSSSDQDALFSKNYRPNIDNKIETDGYYLYNETDTSSGRRYCDFFVLYEDGTCATFDLKSQYWDQLGKTVKNFSSMIFYWNKYFNFYSGGIYKINGDTLIVDMFYDDNLKNVELVKRKYLIKNKITLKQISAKYITCDSTYYRRANRTYRFVKSEPMPNYCGSRIKGKKWLWQNETDWKVYKNEEEIYRQNFYKKDIQ